MSQILRIVFPIIFLAFACDIRNNPEKSPAELFENGVEQFNAQSYQQAEAQLVQALSKFEQLDDGSQAARVGGYLGQIKLMRGEYRAALDQFQSAIQHSRRANDFRAEAHLNMLLGEVFLERGEYANALERFRGAFSYYSAFGDRSASAQIEMRMASASKRAGELEQALSLYERAYGYYSNADESPLAKARALAGVGEIYALQGRHEEALNSFTQSFTAAGSDDPVLEATLRMRAGLSSYALGRLNDALEQYRQSANILRSKGIARSLESLVLFYIGNTYYHNGLYEDAKGYYAQALSVAQSGNDRIAENYNILASLRCDEQLIRSAITQEGVEELVDSYRAVAEGFRACGHRTGEAYARSQMGRLYVVLQDTARAREAYASAVELNESTAGEYVHDEFHRPYVSELGIESDKARWYSALAQLFLSENKLEESLGVLERSVGKRFFDRLFRAAVNARHPQLQAEVQKTREMLREVELLEVEWSRALSSGSDPENRSLVTSLQEEIDRLKNETRQSALRIIEQHPNYEPLVGTGSFSIAEIQKLIPRGTVVLRFLPTDEQLYILVLTRTRLAVRTSPVKRSALLGSVSEYMRLLNDPNVYAGAAGAASVPFMTRFSILASQLYDQMLRPAEALFERNLLIVPGWEFENFPFHATERQDAKGGVQYLVEVSSVDYLPSLASLAYRTAQSARTRDVLALGNPTGKNWSIDYELRDVRSFYRNAKIFIGLEASWKNLTETRGDIVQLSTEFGKMLATQPLGMFVLSGGETVGETREIAFERLTDIPAFPVVFCSNQLVEGEGLSAANALLLRINGTSDVFLNSWYADRKAAKFFSEYFYTHLSNGLAVGDAYRQALLNMIRNKDINHPRSWAQFFHYGTG
ncbi:MAG: CHAT domain-containing tetratricopeptide repeat protein [Ignavibacteriae bacterium]|nr:CHAT domain-containing tetratricopeptide repeat protein [Ignavibacteriota bacterium]